MIGSQRTIFDNVLMYLESNNANFDYIERDSLEVLNMVAEAPTPYKGNAILEAKTALENIQAQISEKQKSERISAIETINANLTKLKSFEDFGKVEVNKQTEIIAPIEKVIREINEERFIGNIRTKANYVATDLYQKQLELMMKLANPPEPTIPGGPNPVVPKITFVNKNSIRINYNKPSLQTIEDVEEYIEAVKKEYLRIVNENKRISL
jgi:hypothetical protein